MTNREDFRDPKEISKLYAGASDTGAVFVKHRGVVLYAQQYDKRHCG